MEDFQYVPPEFFSYLMSHLCCMVTTFPTDDEINFKRPKDFSVIFPVKPGLRKIVKSLLFPRVYYVEDIFAT